MKRYPFAAIINQNHLKTAILVNIVNPLIGGVLITGAKGTGKSTVVRSAETVLPSVSVVKDCPFNCDPERQDTWCTLCRKKDSIQSEEKQMRIVNLPLSCSEDRLVGSVEIETLLAEGRKEIVVGILGEAHRNILYIDEVNLLPDHIVDDILDAAATHWNHIERDGFSIIHPAEFVMIGSMNPEEGDLRPQILDRFALSVRAETIADAALRVELIKRNLLFEHDPPAFNTLFDEQTELIRQGIKNARNILPEVVISERMLVAIAGSCCELKVDGQRPDIVIVKTSRTIAAIEHRRQVKEEDVLRAAAMTLQHRTRDGGLLEAPSPEDVHAVFTRHLQNTVSSSGKTSIETDPGFSVTTGSVDISLSRFATQTAPAGDEKKK